MIMRKLDNDPMPVPARFVIVLCLAGLAIKGFISFYQEMFPLP